MENNEPKRENAPKITYEEIREVRKKHLDVMNQVSERLANLICTGIPESIREEMKEFFGTRSMNFSEPGFEGVVRTKEGKIAWRVNSGYISGVTKPEDRKWGFLLFDQELFEYETIEDLFRLQFEHPITFVKEVSINPHDSDYSDFAMRWIGKDGAIHWFKEVLEQYPENTLPKHISEEQIIT